MLTRRSSAPPINRDECVECYACYNGLEHGTPESADRAHDPQDLPVRPVALRSRAGRLSHRGLRARRTAMAARDPARLLRSARHARIDRSPGPRHRRSEDQRRHRPGEVGRSRIHHRVRPARRRSVAARHPEDDLGAGQGRRGVREEEPVHFAHERRDHRYAARRRARRKGPLGDCRDQSQSGTDRSRSSNWCARSRKTSIPW